MFNRRFFQVTKGLRAHLDAPFWLVTAFKMIVASWWAAPVVTVGFLPFINYFVASASNPYAYFFSHQLSVFPYPAGMLWLASVPFFFGKLFLPAAWFANLHIQLVLFRLPIIISDILIYLIFCHWLPTRREQVRWLYFLSPVLFYINYIHGQLDSIPTALLFLSLLFLFRQKELLAFLFLGLGMATKTHLAIAAPFYLVYLYRRRADWRRLASLTLVSGAIFFLLNPYLWSPGFVEMVFHNPEQGRLFNLFIPFAFGDLKFFLAPAALLLIFFQFVSYRKLNTDSLLLALGLAYTVLVSLVPPAPGWFYWSLPFLIFFLIKFSRQPTFAFWGVNAFFLLYFIGAHDTSVLAADVPANIIFTALETSLIASAVWVYYLGSASNRRYQEKHRSFVVGISGDSGTGKSTLTASFQQVVGTEMSVCLNGDDAHKWERGHEQWRVVSHLNPKANFVHADVEQVIALLNGGTVNRPLYDHRTGTFTAPVALAASKFIFCQGLLSLVLERMRSLYDLKIYLEAAEPLRVRWKVERDGAERGYTEAAAREQIQSRQVDAAQFVHPQKDFADWVITYNEMPTGEMNVAHTLKNSLPLERLAEALVQTDDLRVIHSYPNAQWQVIHAHGRIAAERVAEIAYQLYPSLLELTEHQPEFAADLAGVQQLLFIAHLDHYYQLRG